MDAAGHRAMLQMAHDEVLYLIVDVNGVNHGTGFDKAFGQALRRIAAVGAYLQHAPRAHHAHQHLEQAPLQMPRAHVRIKQLQVRVAVEPGQMLGLGIDVPQDVLFQLLGHDLAGWASNQSTARR